MSRKIIAIRPEPGLSQTVEAARAIGLEIIGYPLFEIDPVDWELPTGLSFDGLLIGSANAIRQGGAELAMLLDIPVYAVGATTASAARAAGFNVVMVGAGGLQSLLDSLRHKELQLLRLAGEEHVPLELSPLHSITTRIVYRSKAVAAPGTLLNSGLDQALVLLHSAAAAEHFSKECNRICAPKLQISLACLGPRIADAAGEGWAEIAIAPEPNDTALLTLVENMCR